MSSPGATMTLVPLQLTRADYDRTRRRIYEVTGAARTDELLPKLCPPWTVVARKITSVAKNGKAAFDDPRSDYCVNPALYHRLEPAADAVAPNSPAYWQRLAANLKAHPLSLTLASLSAAASPPSLGDPLSPVAADVVETVPYLGPSATHVNGPGQALGKIATVGAFAIDVADDRAIWLRDRASDPRTDDWWYGTAWGQELVTFVPPFAVGERQLVPTEQDHGGWAPTVKIDLGSVQTVLMAWPIPYLVGGPSIDPKAVFTIPTPFDPPFAQQTVVPVQSRYLVMAVHPRADAQYPTRIGPPSARVAGWTGHYEPQPKDSFLDKVGHTLEDILRSVARIAASELVIVAVDAFVPGVGIALDALAHAGEDLVGNAVGSVLTPLLQQAGLAPATATGATSSAAVEEDVAAETGGATAGTSAGALARDAYHLDATGALSQLAAVASIAAPKATNDFLAHVAEAAVYADQVLGAIPLDHLLVLTFEELATQAQTTRQGRDALRLRIATLQAQITARGGKWLAVAKQALSSATKLIVAVATAGVSVAVEATLEAVDLSITAGTMALNLVQARELAQAAAHEADARRTQQLAQEEASLQALRDEVAKLEAELAAGGSKASTAASGLSRRTKLGIGLAVAAGVALAVGTRGR